MPLISERRAARLLAIGRDPSSLAADPVRSIVSSIGCSRQADAARLTRRPCRFGAERITYRELNDRADSLAMHLRTLGVGRGDPRRHVPPANPPTAVAILGVFKAGGASVPSGSGVPG